MHSKNHAENWVKLLRDFFKRRVVSWVRIYEQNASFKIQMILKNGEIAFAPFQIAREENYFLQIENIVLKQGRQVGNG